jgi:alginate O-acetyltransferase complex protein AlgI
VTIRLFLTVLGILQESMIYLFGRPQARILSQTVAGQILAILTLKARRIFSEWLGQEIGDAVKMGTVRLSSVRDDLSRLRKMELTSALFLLFLIASLAVYYLLPRRPQNYWLLIVSYVFCITWAWQFALVLLIVTFVNFVLGLRLRRDNQGRRNILWIGLAFNILVLAFFRTSDFFVPQLTEMVGRFGFGTGLGILQFLVPVGLSFYIVENISYLIDVYKGQTKATTDPVDFALYLAYFPKLLAGPIERASQFLPILARQRIVDNDVLARSTTLIAVGLVRKLLIADTLTAAIPIDVFAEPGLFQRV